MPVDDIISRLKRLGAESIEPGQGVSGIDVEPAARDLVNDLARYPHAFVLACIADRQTKADIAWRLPHAIREAASGFDLGTLLRLPKEEWASVLASSGHRLGTEMARLLPLRARELSPEWPGELDWPAWHLGAKWCHAGRAPECGECYMGSVCPRVGVALRATTGS